MVDSSNQKMFVENGVKSRVLEALIKGVPGSVRIRKLEA
jgi:hypothetical protein